MSSRRRLSLLLLLLLAVASQAPEWSVGSPRAGNSSGMASAAPRLNGSAGVRALELAHVRPGVLVTRRAPVEDSPISAAGQHSIPNLSETYLPEVIAEGGSQLKRWAHRVDAPIRVWIASGDSVPGFRDSFVPAVRNAFFAWEQSEVPVRFVFVDSSAHAEVKIEWTERLPDRRAGLAHWWTNSEGWLTKTNIVLATQLSDDGRADDTSVHRMALHEIGHLLGLEHSLDAGDIMSPWVNANELTARDRATARLLYALPPGEISSDVDAIEASVGAVESSVR